LRPQRFKIETDDLPNEFKVYTGIVMDNTITQASDFMPWDTRVLVLELLGELSRGFA
jgi:hypothetical protein